MAIPNRVNDVCPPSLQGITSSNPHAINYKIPNNIIHVCKSKAGDVAPAREYFLLFYQPCSWALPACNLIFGKLYKYN